MWSTIATILVSGILFGAGTSAVPIPATTAVPQNMTARSSSIVPSPVFFAYDKNGNSNFPSPDELKGFNIFALTFYTSNGPAGSAQAWGGLPQSDRQSWKKKYNSAGIKIVVSLFGGEDDSPSRLDAKKFAGEVVTWVKNNDLDGVDVDYEDFAAMADPSSNQIQWLSDLTTTLRGGLPSGKYILSHAPVAYWFTPSPPAANGKAAPNKAYLDVNKRVGKQIDFYNVQFYNNGDDFTDCNSLLKASTDSSHPKISLGEIIASGIPKNKIVIGKPVTSADASEGNMDASTLAGCLKSAKATGWGAGVMAWAWPDADAQWIQTVRSKAFPE